VRTFSATASADEVSNWQNPQSSENWPSGVDFQKDVYNRKAKIAVCETIPPNSQPPGVSRG
jgi:hypothetical protein